MSSQSLRFTHRYGRLSAPSRYLFVGGHQPGYTQNRNHGKFAPGDGGEHASGESGGSGGGGRAAAAASREAATRARASRAGRAIAAGTSGEQGPRSAGGGERAYMRKATTIQAEHATSDSTLHTLEGDQHVKAGDWVVTGVKGEQYSMSHEAFTARYRESGSGTPGEYTRIQERVTAHRATPQEVGSTIRTNGGRELAVSKGDMIVRQADGDHAVVKPDIFKATYDEAPRGSAAHQRVNAALPVHPDYQQHGVASRDLAHPTEYTAESVRAADVSKMPKGGDTRKFWADPADPHAAAALRPGGKFTSSEGAVKLDSAGRPLNPWGETGVTGRGLLGKWGANQAEDAIVTRVNNGQLEVATIHRADASGKEALPGGMVDAGERGGAAFRREFGEETGGKITSQPASSVYKGYVADPRNTNNAWMETNAYHVHLNAKDGAAMTLQGNDDAMAAHWTPATRSLMENMYGNHGAMLRSAVREWSQSTGNHVTASGRVLSSHGTAHSAEASASKSTGGKETPEARATRVSQRTAAWAQRGSRIGTAAGFGAALPLASLTMNPGPLLIGGGAGLAAGYGLGKAAGVVAGKLGLSETAPQRLRFHGTYGRMLLTAGGIA